MDFRLADIVSNPQLLRSTSPFLAQKMGKLDCSGIDSLSREQLDALFANIPDDWGLDELIEVIEEETMSDRLSECILSYLGIDEDTASPVPNVLRDVDERYLATAAVAPIEIPAAESSPDSLDVFQLRDRVIEDYRQYIQSFLKIQDPNIQQFVNQQLDRGALWKDVLVQLNPAYEPGAEIDTLIDEDVLHPGCRDFFPSGFRFYLHQDRAFRCYHRRESYVLTTGTGSGKSLSYVVPIFDDLLRNPDVRGVRAILVYPMNALINSQKQEFEKYLDRATGAGKSRRIRVESYTGQDDLATKSDIQNNPPHILLTNYVMLELMLSRLDEKSLVESQELRFLVLDELHTYRGRQGADVALLVRKLRERCGQDLLCIGTSATMATEGTRDNRRTTVANVARQLFGTTIRPDNVIDETLKLSVTRPEPTKAELAQSLQAELPSDRSLTAFQTHPLSFWIERQFGLKQIEDRWERRTPISLEQGAKTLSEQTGITSDRCLTQLRQMLLWSGQLDNALQFRLHQFISQGGNVYATLEADATRELTLDGQYATTGDRLLYPLVFCRECGQHYYSVHHDTERSRLEPRLSGENRADEDTDENNYSNGYFVPDDGETLWNGDRLDDLPESWFKTTQREGTQPKPKYRPFIPQSLHVRANGQVETGAVARSNPDRPLGGWFVPQPFRVCLNCGIVHDARRSEFAKLGRLSSEGRSTATTLLCLSAVRQLRASSNLDRSAAKVLSFTDNRQDASLQAGHFNDFVRTSLLRSALCAALQQHGSLDYDRLPQAVFEQLGLNQEDYAKVPAEFGQAQSKNKQVFEQAIEYRLYEDLRRGWRIVQPNLEQCGLLDIKYKGLREVCQSHDLWSSCSLHWQRASAKKRFYLAKILLDSLRRELAVNADFLQPEGLEQFQRRAKQELKPEWGVASEERLQAATRASLDTGQPSAAQQRYRRNRRKEVKLTARSKFGRFLKAYFSPTGTSLSSEAVEKAIADLVHVLQRSAHLSSIEGGVQLNVACILWCSADRQTVSGDPLSKRYLDTQHEGLRVPEVEVNAFFQQLYRENSSDLQQLRGSEHTGQVENNDRQHREEQFRRGDLAALFCSPTMELGIDIADLNLVHLRNLPPNPANYAQRSGRAGRSGQGALVVSYASVGSGHDQYFYQRPEQMVAGVVAPPKLELGNEDLLEAHLHSIWLAETGVRLGDAMTDVLDLGETSEHYPLRADLRQGLTLSRDRLQVCIERAQKILQDPFCQHDLKTKPWYSKDWVAQVFENALQGFDRACDRWRTLYQQAIEQRDEARRVIDRAPIERLSKRERDSAEQLQRDAQRQIDILIGNLGRASGQSLDFYTYRYFATEGFLPGYNFPRLPVRAYIPYGENGRFIVRPRAIAIRELAPSNIVYYEGNKFQIARSAIVRGTEQDPYQAIDVCWTCGYFHSAQAGEAHRETCDRCGARIESDDRGTPARLTRVLEMQTAIARRRDRITCDEEERLKYGYNLTTHYRFASSPQTAVVRAADGEPLLELTYGDSATIRRINRGLRKNTSQRGFEFDPQTGEWRNPDDRNSGRTGANSSTTSSANAEVYLSIKETSNVLLVKLTADALPERDRESCIVTIQYAIERAIQATYKLEEGELLSERLGKAQNLLFWESSEGGAGVLSQIVADPHSLRKIAQSALEICHFITPKKDCFFACYECLLSYHNQFDRALIKRDRIKDWLYKLEKSTAYLEKNGGKNNLDREQKYRELIEQTDPASDLERQVLEAIYHDNLPLPDTAQELLAEANCKPDFIYHHSKLAIFCDGSVHDNPEQRQKDQQIRQDLLWLTGYHPFVIRYDESLPERLKALSKSL